MVPGVRGLCQLDPRGAAELLAQGRWPALYPVRLAENTVPCAAAIYDDDMYVERALSVETADDRTWDLGL